jgi:hypothetical protein
LTFLLFSFFFFFLLVSALKVRRWETATGRVDKIWTFGFSVRAFCVTSQDEVLTWRNASACVMTADDQTVYVGGNSDGGSNNRSSIAVLESVRDSNATAKDRELHYAANPIKELRGHTVRPPPLRKKNIKTKKTAGKGKRLKRDR